MCPAAMMSNAANLKTCLIAHHGEKTNKLTWPAVMMPNAAGRRLRPRMETRRGEVAAIQAWAKMDSD